MTAWDAALQIAKFLALAVSAASGVYATLHDTRDKKGKLTPAGRVVFRCVILSFVVGAASQSLEMKSTADKLKREETEKSDALEKDWRLERPFGQWKARLSVKNIHLNEGNDEWIKKILAYAHRPNVMPKPNRLVIRPTSEVYPTGDRGDYVAELLVPSRVMIEPTSEPGLYPNGGNPNVLGFDLKPGTGTFVAHINDSKTEVTAFDLYDLEMTCEHGADTPLISNWIDLYGREMTLSLDGQLGSGDYVGFSLFYDNPHELGYECSLCVSTSEAGDHSFKKILTEKELGPFPVEYKTLFPAKFREIEQRMSAAEKGPLK